MQASETDPDNIYLSISTPSLSHEALPATGLPEFTLQEARKLYHKFAEIVEPTKEGYALTLKLNFSGLTRPKGISQSFQFAFGHSNNSCLLTLSLEVSLRSGQGYQPDITAAIRGP